MSAYVLECMYAYRFVVIADKWSADKPSLDSLKCQIDGTSPDAYTCMHTHAPIRLADLSTHVHVCIHMHPSGD